MFAKSWDVGVARFAGAVRRRLQATVRPVPEAPGVRPLPLSASVRPPRVDGFSRRTALPALLFGDETAYSRGRPLVPPLFLTFSRRTSQVAAATGQLPYSFGVTVKISLSALPMMSKRNSRTG
jgi:hypothetical protein